MKRLILCLMTFALVFALSFMLASCTTDNSNKNENDNNQNINNNTNNDVRDETPNHVHTFDQAVVAEKYKKSSATCTSRAKYYYSCYDCGAKGSETFDYGPYSHEYNPSTNECTKCHEEYLVYERADNGTYRVIGAVNPLVDIINVPEYVISGQTKIYVTAIADDAFTSLSELSELIIGNNVGTIGKNAFRNCEKLTTVTIGANLASVDTDAFHGCSSIAKVQVDNINTWLGIEFISPASNPLCAAAELYTSSGLLTELRVNNVRKINNHSFYGCSSLSSILLEGAVESIGNYAFANCHNLSVIDLSKNVNSFGYKAFEGCASFKSVNIHDLTAWCNIPFGSPASNPIFYASNLYLDGQLVTNLTIPSDVTDIQPYAFYGCNSINTLVIPESIIHIGASAFHACKGLNAVDIDEGVIEIGNSAFSNCESLKYIDLPSTLLGINYDAFASCPALSIVNIPDIASWCDIVFDNAEANPVAASADLYENGSLVTDLVIPSAVASINHYAFYNCTSFRSITIGHDVKSIGEYAFYNCTGVEVLNYNAVSVNDLYINNYAFTNLGASTSGTAIVIGQNVEYIPEYLFMPSFPGENVPNISSLRFKDNAACESIGNYAFAYCTSLDTIEIAESVKNIGNHAFYKCYALYDITILIGDAKPEVKIGDYAFAYCTALSSLDIPASVLSIGSFAFAECNNISWVNLGTGIESIGYKAFFGCENLKKVYNNSHLTLEKFSTSNGYITYYFDRNDK